MNSHEFPWESFESARGDQKASPGLIVEAADLHYGMPVGSVVNKLTVANVHAGVSNFLRRRAEKE